MTQTVGMACLFWKGELLGVFSFAFGFLIFGIKFCIHYKWGWSSIAFMAPLIIGILWAKSRATEHSFTRSLFNDQSRNKPHKTILFLSCWQLQSFHSITILIMMCVCVSVCFCVVKFLLCEYVYMSNFFPFYLFRVIDSVAASVHDMY